MKNKILFMQRSFEQAVEVVRELSPVDLERLEKWLETRKSEQSAGKNSESDVNQKRMRWLKENRAEYGGQYVVLDGDCFLGTAKSYPEGKKLAAAAGVPDAFVSYLSRPDEEGFMGGW